MSETALTLVKAAMRSIGALVAGATPSTAEQTDGLEALKIMLRNWSARDIRIYYTKQESLALDGSESYTIGTSGDLNTVRPSSIRGAWTTDGPVKIIDEDRYRQVRHLSLAGGIIEYLWYSPEHPLGLLYPWPRGSTTLYIDSLKPLTEPSLISSDVAFPPEYDAAIKWNLAVELAPEYGVEPSPIVLARAQTSLAAIETRNFAAQISAIRPELIRLAYTKYDIDAD